MRGFKVAQQRLDPAIQRKMDAVHRYEGTVNQVLGDGIMALFGAPIAHEDHALRACYAALAMQAAIREYTEAAHSPGQSDGASPNLRRGSAGDHPGAASAAGRIARRQPLPDVRPAAAPAEYQHGWGNKTYYTQLRLDPLPPVSATELLHALLGDDPSLEPLTLLLIAHTEGNPFFLEESVHTLVETGVLVGTPRAYRLAQAVPSIQVPATVQAVLAARIDRRRPRKSACCKPPP